MTQPIEFSNQTDAGNGAFAVSQAFQDIKEAAHEHLLTRIEELGAEFGRWSRSAPSSASWTWRSRASPACAAFPSTRPRCGRSPRR
uniref:Uncharacterized protein n=1 Tax=Ralstonia solanacearum TaxID=305 RepID=A0A0S4V4E3_RALSL|nr:protein of unknown function [Ralstonia solanacearum]